MADRLDKLVLITDYTWSSIDIETRVLAEVGARVVVAPSAEEEELRRQAAGADAILTCFAPLPGSVIRAARKLQVIGRFGIGVDNVDLAEATRLGVPVTNVPAYCLDEVAEHVLSLILCWARNVCRYDAAVRRGDWSLTAPAPLHRVRGQTLGVVGFGKIGSTLAAKAAGLGLRVLAYDPVLDDAAIRARSAEPVSLERLLAEADFVSLHTPLTDETRRLIDERRLRQMKPTAFLVNTSRGGVIDQEALVTALREGWIAGAGLDVFEPERIPPDHPLLARSNVLVTPHAAFYSEESVQELRRLAAENVAAVLAGRRPPSLVNPEVLELPRWAHLVS
jgi:D-3-phosphoglycerate dehydrogenase